MTLTTPDVLTPAEAIFTRHPDWAVVTTPPTPEDERLYREAAWE